MHSYPTSVGGLASPVSGKDCKYTGEPDKVQAPTATAPGVVSLTMPMPLCHFLLSFGWFSLHLFCIAAQKLSKNPQTFNMATPSRTMKAHYQTWKWNERLFLHLNILLGSLGLPSFEAKREVQGFNWSRDTSIRWERWERKDKDWRQRGGKSGAEGKMQTSEREGKLIEMKLGQDTIDTRSWYNSLIKLYLNYRRAVKPLCLPFCHSLLQFEQLHCEREA